MIQRFLTSIDLVGTPVSLTFSGQEKAKTNFGGACSLLFFCFVGWACYNGSRDLLSTTNPRAISYEVYTQDPKETTITPQNFPIAFGMRMPTNLSYELYIDETIFKVNVFHALLQRIKHSNGTIEEKWTYTDLDTEKCTLGYFGEIASSFSNLNVSLMYCLAKNQSKVNNLKIQGAFESTLYQSIYIQISQCENSTSSVPCAPQATIDASLQGGWFTTFYANTAINPKNYNRPDSKSRDLYYSMLNTEYYRETEIEIGHVEMATDSGWIVENIKSQSFNKVNKINEHLNFAAHPKKILISCIYQMSRLETYYSRSYKKVQEVLAEVGGLVNPALIFLLIITTPYLKLKLHEALMNELFDVIVPKEENKDKNKKNGSAQKAKTNNKQDLPKIAGNDLYINEIDKLTPNNKDIEADEKSDMKMPTNNSIFSTNQARDGGTSSLYEPFQLNFQTTRKDNIKGEQSPIRPINSKKSGAKVGTWQNARVHAIKGSVDVPLIEFAANSPSNQTDLKIKEVNETKAKEKNANAGEVNDLGSKSPEKLNILFETPTNRFNQRKMRDDLRIGKMIIEKKSESPEGEMRTLMRQETNEEDNQKWQLKPTPGSTERGQELRNIKRIKIDLTVWEYLCSFIYKSKSFKQKIKVLDDGIKSVEERMDIIKILKKLREVDKLRVLLLNLEQIQLFNNLPKPEIRPPDLPDFSENKSLLYSALKRKNFIDDYTTENQVLEAYKEVNLKESKSDIDRKLIEIFDNKE